MEENAEYLRRLRRTTRGLGKDLGAFVATAGQRVLALHARRRKLMLVAAQREMAHLDGSAFLAVARSDAYHSFE